MKSPQVDSVLKKKKELQDFAGFARSFRLYILKTSAWFDWKRSDANYQVKDRGTCLKFQTLIHWNEFVSSTLRKFGISGKLRALIPPSPPLLPFPSPPSPRHRLSKTWLVSNICTYHSRLGPGLSHNRKYVSEYIRPNRKQSHLFNTPSFGLRAWGRPTFTSRGLDQ